MSTPPGKLLVVQLRSTHYGPPVQVRGAFRAWAEAEDCQRELEERLRPTLRRHNLFWEDPHTYRSPPGLSAFDLPVLLDLMQDADILLPADPESDLGWQRWWLEQCEQLTDEQLRHFLAGLHHLTFHEIVEVDLIDDAAWDAQAAVAQETALARAQFQNLADESTLPRYDPRTGAGDIDEDSIPF